MTNFQLTKIRQHFSDNSMHDVKKEVRRELLRFDQQIKAGKNIAISVASRGIDNLELIVKETVSFVKEKGAIPFIIPAMGSHGGATVEGQLAILTDYGITEDKIGVPVRATMEVVEIKNEENPNRLFMDKMAYASDGVLMINKIKPHTDFRGKYESGLAKMSVIGLGNEKGANAIHKFGVYGLSHMLQGSAKNIISTGKILGGIAIVENASDRTMLIRALLANEIIDKEPELLDLAKRNRPTFPVEDIDVLILDRMGKNISGAGIDTNIIGRIKIYGQDEPGNPSIKSIVVTDLTNESHGNAIGIGLADVITKKLKDKIDFFVTYTNVVTSSFFERGKIPVVAETDQEAMQYALRSCGYIKPGNERIIRLRDTLHLEVLYVSDGILKEIQSKDQIEIIETGKELFDRQSFLTVF